MTKDSKESPEKIEEENGEKDYGGLLKQADEKMYENKQARKKALTNA